MPPPWIQICLYVTFYMAVVYSTGENIPCAPRMKDSGYVCVCNESYCDTIQPPTPIARGSFYHYITSKNNPGFSMSTGRFDSLEEEFPAQPSSDSNFFFWVDANVTFQTVWGVGGAFTDSTGINFNYLSPNAREKFIESYFGKSGIEYTFGRVPIGATDFSTRWYSYDEVPGDVYLQHFNLSVEDFSLKIPMIKKAIMSSERAIKLLATPWTAPSWMKTNNDFKPGYLLTKYHRTYVNYLLKFLEHYRQNGIDFWGISQGNELGLGLMLRFRLPNVIMLPPQNKAWTKNHFGPMFKQSIFKNLKILALDDQRPFISWWERGLLDDKESAKYIDGIALHMYLDSEQNTFKLDEYNRKYPDKFLIYTESSIIVANKNAKGAHSGSWEDADSYIQDIIQNYKHGSVGYMDWNMALDENGGPNFLDYKTDGTITVSTENGEFYKQPLFYALGHFSKFIHPGSVVMEIIKNGSVDNFQDREIGGKKVGDPVTTTTESQSTTTGKPPGPPGPPGPGATVHPGPPPGPPPLPIGDVDALATLNPDGSRTVIVHNPKSVPIKIIVTDPHVGVINKTISEDSISTFVYW